MKKLIDYEFCGNVVIPASAGAGRILTSDANGLATWQAPSSGTIDPTTIAFVSPAFNNTNNRYSTISNALSATTGSITLIIYSGTYAMPTSIGTAYDYRNVNFTALGNVILSMAAPTSLWGDYIFSGEGLTLGGTQMYLGSCNIYVNCKEINCVVNSEYSNAYINVKNLYGNVFFKSGSYVQIFELNAQRVGLASDLTMSFTSTSGSDGSVKAYINALYGRMNLSVANQVDLIANGGLFENYTGRLLNASGTGYKASIKPTLGRINFNGTSAGQGIDAQGNGRIDISNTKWESTAASTLFSGSNTAKINVAFCTVATPTPTTSPFGSLGIANLDRALWGDGVF